MKKVLLFLLTIAIALGGIAYAHAAVTERQDDLLIYPMLETGDLSVLDGRTASMTFACGEHLRWYTDYTFGSGLTEAEFEFNHEGFGYGEAGTRAQMDVYFTGGMGSSISGGSFSLNNTEYGALLKAVAVVTPDGGSKTMNLRMADYVTYYLPDYDLAFDNGEMVCEEQMSLHSQITGEGWYDTPEAYEAFFADFRFPVQADHIISVTVEKTESGLISGIDLYPENGPGLHYISDVNETGVFFVPVFQDEDGQPLPYESPMGHGIYYAPWKESGKTFNSSNEEATAITPDMENLARLVPLDETLSIQHMEIDGEAGEAWMLTLEEDGYIMTIFDLASGETVKRIPALPHDPAAENDWSHFVRAGGDLLVTAQDRLALIDMASKELLLTAPDWQDQRFSTRYFDPNNGDLHFDGENLILLGTANHRDGTFWTAIYRQGERVYYGEYECSLMRGNDDWYYSSITVNQDPIELK